MVFFSVGVWIAILVYAYLPHHLTKFSQDACRKTSVAEVFFLGAPFIFVWAAATTPGAAGIFVLLIIAPVLVIAAWVFAIIYKRKEIWPPGERYRPRFGKVWWVHPCICQKAQKR